jgi:hypothetical protein
MRFNTANALFSLAIAASGILSLPAYGQANGTFNEACYLQRYPDVVTGWVNNGGKAIDHWLRHGQYEGRIPDCRGMAQPAPAPNPAPGPNPPPPSSGGAYTIVGGGPRPIEISVDPKRFAGSVTSLKWNGVEFVNIHDHGRQIQTAIQVDGFSECNNPTEAGSSHDVKSSTSTSKLLAHSKIASNQMANSVQMAYWSYRKLTGACPKGIDSRITSPLSNTILDKRITIGAFGDNQIVSYALAINHGPRDVTQSVVYEFLTGYLNSEFKRFFFVTTQNGALNEFLPSELRDISGNGFPPGSYQAHSNRKKTFDPIILSNPSGSHAMAAYVPPSQITSCGAGFGYAAFHFNLGGSGPKGSGTNKWNMASYESVNSKCIVNGVRRYNVYIAVGTLSEVHSKLQTLIRSAK